MRKLFLITYKFFWSIAATLLTCGMEGHAPGIKKVIMKRAKFSWEIKTQGSRWCLVITDLRTAADNCMSVTQDMEKVIEYIEYNGRLRAERFIIVYWDGEVWDGWDARTQKFVLLRCASWPEAVKKFVCEALQPQHA